MFRFSEESNYTMPAHFGADFEGPWPAGPTYPDVTSIIITYETDPGMLAHYIPEGFELTQSVVTIAYSMNRGLEWLGGGAYNLISVNAPVAYPHGQDRLEGQYALVVWENKTDPIIHGREQGVPKLFADIQDLHQLGDRLFIKASYEGSAFLRMEVRKTKAMAPEELTTLNQQWAANSNWFGWRYIPNLGRPGAALSYATLFPQEFAYTQAWRGEGRVQWEALLPEEHPIQARMIEALSQLPIRAYRDCLTAQGSLVIRNDLARPLP